MKKVLIVVLCLLLAVSLISCSGNSYLQNAGKAYKAMLLGGSASELLSAKAYDAWRSAIFDDDNPYEDFNAALSFLYSLDAAQTIITAINDASDIANQYMKELKNPPKEYKNLYDALVKLNDVYYDYSQLAISPSGSLQTYSESTTDVSKAFSKFLDRAKGEFPDDFDFKSLGWTDEEKEKLLMNDTYSNQENPTESATQGPTGAAQ